VRDGTQAATALGESQQAFAYRMKTAIRTVARYETSTPPKGKGAGGALLGGAIPEMPNWPTCSGRPRGRDLASSRKFTQLGALASQHRPRIHGILL